MLTLPDAARNPVSLAGMAVATAAAVVFLALFALDLAGYLPNPYVGLVVFVALPALFGAGLLLIPAGAWWAARRRRRGEAPPQWPVIDLRDARQRGIVLGVFALTVVNVIIVSIGAYGGVHYMDSNAFCGQVCHVTMEPQAAAHAAWPHARVSCTQCHVGPGAGGFLQAKATGARQLLHIVTGRVPAPIVASAGRIPPPVVTCQQCHAPGLRHGERLRTSREFAADEGNTETTTSLRLKVGDDQSGIHRHVSMEIDFVPASGAEVIPLVRLKQAGRVVREYPAPGAGGAVAATRFGTMSCTDCHSRPAHTFASTPERAVDTALAAAAIPRSLAFVRREAVAAVGASYPSRAEALEGIATRLNGFYRGRGGVNPADVERAVAGAQTVWAGNVFPRMKVTWGTYTNHLGHVDSPGCFRCHDDRRSADGRGVISQECELCHSLPE